MWGEVEIGAGDWVVADRDGMVVVPETDADTVVAAAQARARNEDTMFAALQAGATTVELLDLDESPIARGDQ